MMFRGQELGVTVERFFTQKIADDVKYYVTEGQKRPKVLQYCIQRSYSH